MVDHARAAAVFPEVYFGYVGKGNNRPTVVEAAERLGLPPLIRRYGSWVVTTRGLHSLQHDTHIIKEKLYDKEWLEEILEESGLEFEDFCKALTTAQTMREMGVI